MIADNSSRKKVFYYLLFSNFLISLTSAQQPPKTEITRWQYAKTTAVSITYDDGSSNQFKTALPIMEKLKLPATFFVITGPIKGSFFPAKFVGRPVKEIISETLTIPTNAHNFFERASASLYLGYKGAQPYYNQADEFYESGKKVNAYRVMDSLYKAVRNDELPPGKDTTMEFGDEAGLTWNQVKQYAREGYEFASHTVTHAHLAILDTANMAYELKKSKEEIMDHLGPIYTFSAEVPFGIEDPRVMKFGFPIYEALRNLMPEPYMKEINRGYKDQPGQSHKEYVQWQRGPLAKTEMNLMKSWVDTSLAHANIWLVLVFHGIDNIGWEPTSHEKLKEYFQYIKNREDNIWVAPFGEVARYVRERMDAKVETKISGKGKITVKLTESLKHNTYNEPLTLKTYLPSGWKKAEVRTQGGMKEILSQKDQRGTFILYQAVPGNGSIKIIKV